MSQLGGDAKRRALLNAFPDVGFILDADGTYVDVMASPETSDLLYADEEAMVGKQLSDLLPEPKASELLAPVRRALATGELQTLEYSMMVEEGRRWFEARISPVPSAGESPNHVVWVARDVTERERSKRQLERERSYTAAMLDSLGDLFYVLDDEGRFVDWNRTFAAVTGYEEDQLMGMEPFELFPDYEHDDLDETLASVLAGGSASLEADLLTSGGERIPYEFVLDAFEDPDGETLLAGVGRDVTERREREQQVQVFGRLLRHNLRNQMTVIAGTALDVKSRLPDDLSAELTTMHDACRDLLSTARKAQRSAQLLEEPTARERIELGTECARLAGKYEERFPEATLRTDVPADLAVRAVPAICPALGELVENGIVHGGDDPTVEVTARRRRNRVAIEVVDDGPGIPAAELRAVDAGGETQLAHASGIGLWFVTWVVRRSRGSLSVDAGEGGGTVATVELQAAE